MYDYKIRIREANGCYETFNESNGELAFADTLTEIAKYAISNGLGLEFEDWDDDDD
jgi:hypothetical protein